MIDACQWPNGVCQWWAAQHAKPDPFGRVRMHCVKGLSMNNASLACFMSFCLRNNVEIEYVYALRPEYKRSSVMASVRLRPDQVEAFERETGGKLRKPPRVKLNSEDSREVMPSEECNACDHLGYDCGEHLPAWEELAIYWKAQADRMAALLQARIDAAGGEQYGTGRAADGG